GAMDGRLTEAQADLLAAVEREKTALGKDLQLTLARARADSRSLLEEQERQIAEERRTLVAEREHDATAALGDKLNQVQAQVEQRLAGWAEDLNRAAEARPTGCSGWAPRSRTSPGARPSRSRPRRTARWGHTRARPPSGSRSS